MIKYAYIDRGDILHITKDEATAARYSKKKANGEGHYVPTAVEAKNGYPLDEDGNHVIMYSETETRYPISEKKLGELALLYREIAAAYK